MGTNQRYVWGTTCSKIKPTANNILCPAANALHSMCKWSFRCTMWPSGVIQQSLTSAKLLGRTPSDTIVEWILFSHGHKYGLKTNISFWVFVAPKIVLDYHPPPPQNCYFSGVRTHINWPGVETPVFDYFISHCPRLFVVVDANIWWLQWRQWLTYNMYALCKSFSANNRLFSHSSTSVFSVSSPKSIIWFVFFLLVDVGGDQLDGWTPTMWQSSLAKSKQRSLW
jgi:hypothetical protein